MHALPGVGGRWRSEYARAPRRAHKAIAPAATRRVRELEHALAEDRAQLRHKVAGCEYDGGEVWGILLRIIYH